MPLKLTSKSKMGGGGGGGVYDNIIYMHIYSGNGKWEMRKSANLGLGFGPFALTFSVQPD